MKDLVILGIDVHSAEMAHIVERINRQESTWNLLGHIAPNDSEMPTQFAGRPVLGIIEKLVDYPNAAIVPCATFPKSVEFPTGRVVNLIDPSAYVHPTVTMGKGCVLYPNCFIGFNARLGNYVWALSGVTINHDDVIGARTEFASDVTLAGCVAVEADCYMGQSCTVREHLRVGRNSLIGMGAVVVENVEPNSVMVGNPARRLKSRPNSSLAVSEDEANQSIQPTS